MAFVLRIQNVINNVSGEAILNKIEVFPLNVILVVLTVAIIHIVPTVLVWAVMCVMRFSLGHEENNNTSYHFSLKSGKRYSVHMSLLENKRVGFDYEILETIEAGLELLGLEVKSLRAGHGSLKGARVVARGGEAFLVGATIPAWQVANAPKSYEPDRTRRLLLTQKEIAHISSAEGQKGLTIVPLAVYNKGRKLKLSVAIVRGKKSRDKRQTIRQREEKRQIERSLKK